MEEPKVGYAGYEDTRTFDKDKDYLEGFFYPCIILNLAGADVPKSRMQTLKSMIEGSSVDTNITVEPVNLYFQTESKTVLVGKLQARQIKSFMKLFDSVPKVGYLTADKRLDGDMIYVLST